MAVLTYIPTSSVGGFPFLHTLSSIYCLYFFDDGHRPVGEAYLAACTGFLVGGAGACPPVAEAGCCSPGELGPVWGELPAGGCVLVSP